jgi:hypothetical protein
MPDYYPLVHRWPIAPGIRLDGEFLRYAPFPRDTKKEKLRFAERPTLRLLSDFVALAKASAAEIEAYAQKWSVLGLCQHGTTAHLDDHPAGRICPPIPREPLKGWRHVAGYFDNIVHRIERSRANQAKAREVVAFVNYFAHSFGHLRPVAAKTGDGFSLRLAGGPLAPSGLAAALTYQLLVAVTGGRGWLICDECGKWFEPDVRRSPERRAFCPKCSRAAAVRAASRDYYSKHRKQVLERQARRRKGK